MARIRFWQGSSLLVAVAPLVAAACLSSCTDDTTSGRPDAAADGGTANDVSDAVAKAANAQVVERGDDGLPNFVRGDFGRLPAGQGALAAPAAPNLAAVAPLFKLQASDLRLDRVKGDELGFRHFKYRQQINGEDVIGAELVVHVDASGLAYAAQGNARPAQAVPDALLRQAPADLGADYAAATRAAPKLVYVQSSRDGKVYRAWQVIAEGVRDGDPFRDRVYVDALTGQTVDVHPEFHSALNRRVYSGNNTSSLPGTLRRSEGQAPTTDNVVNGNYDHLGGVYNCYKTLFNRDSYNGAGAQLVSTVHHQQNYVNAFWNGSQMVYGDGDNVTASSLALSFDVTAHELTHAVTDTESDLIYQNESGAINEAMSDIFAA
ncbi:MAG TPA: M4 family metallopeptidase, partial [Polyangiaceae bacterium]|nr:M4 family metallopeptidase [Polyangiaceae bacterium]